MESRLLEILVCPLCKSRLQHDREHHELICRADKLAFPIRDGVPIMLESQARRLGPHGGAAAKAPGSPATGSPGAGSPVAEPPVADATGGRPHAPIDDA